MEGVIELVYGDETHLLKPATSLLHQWCNTGSLPRMVSQPRSMRLFSCRSNVGEARNQFNLTQRHKGHKGFSMVTVFLRVLHGFV